MNLKELEEAKDGGVFWGAWTAWTAVNHILSTYILV